MTIVVKCSKCGTAFNVVLEATAVEIRQLKEVVDFNDLLCTVCGQKESSAALAVE